MRSTLLALKTTRSRQNFSGDSVCVHQVAAGTAIVLSSGKTHVLVEDGYLIQNAGTAHAVEAISAPVLSLCLHPRLLSGISFEQCLFPRDYEIDRTTTALIKSESPKERARAATELVDALKQAHQAVFQEYFLANRGEEKDDRGNTMRAAREFILTNLASPMSVAEIARHVGMSEFHFLRIFREWHGMTPAKYVATERVRRACRRLILTDCPIQNIAVLAGYQSPTSFARTFKSITGLNPAQFRIRHESHRARLNFFAETLQNCSF